MRQGNPSDESWLCCRANPPAGGERKDMFDEALARCLAFQAAGADIVYAEGLETQGVCCAWLN